MESRPEFEKVTAGHEAQIFRHAKLILDTPDTPIGDFVAAEQTVERLRDSFVDYFQRYDALLCPVTPFPATRHGLADLVIDGETVSPFHVMSATSPFSLTGMPALSMRFGTSHDGLPIGVQIVSAWLAESTALQVASLLEEVRCTNAEQVAAEVHSTGQRGILGFSEAEAAFPISIRIGDAQAAPACQGRLSKRHTVISPRNRDQQRTRMPLVRIDIFASTSQEVRGTICIDQLMTSWAALPRGGP
jgi:hypothetical protein